MGENKNTNFIPKYRRNKSHSLKNDLPSRISSNRVDTGSKVDLAKKQGVYSAIKYKIRKTRKNDPDCTFDDVMQVLCQSFPKVFGKFEEVRNTRNIIESDNGWSMAFYDYDDNIVDKIEARMEDILLSDSDSDAEIMSKFELIKKYEILKDRAISERIKVKAELQEAENECKRLDKLLDKAAEEVTGGDTFIDTIIINGDDNKDDNQS